MCLGKGSYRLMIMIFNYSVFLSGYNISKLLECNVKIHLKYWTIILPQEWSARLIVDRYLSIQILPVIQIFQVKMVF